jgi:hypothetical protein
MDVRIAQEALVVARQQEPPFFGANAWQSARPNGAIAATSAEEVGLISPAPGDVAG